MIINRLVLKNFGKFQNKEIILKEGVNVIYGENESGKSTVHMFLQGLFFGMRRMRGRASRSDPYTKYTPWEQSGWYEGAAEFTCNGKTFRLERNFKKPAKEALLFCQTDGELLSVEDGDLDMLLGNITEVVYQNTVSVGQAKSRTEEGLYKELRDYLADFQGSGDFGFSPDKALEWLKEKKKYWKKQEEKEVAGKEKAEHELAFKIRHEKEEISTLQRQSGELERRISEMQAEKRAAEKMAAERRPAERTAAERTPAERVAAERTPAERVAAERRPVERTSAERSMEDRTAARRGNSRAESGTAENREGNRAEDSRKGRMSNTQKQKTPGWLFLVPVLLLLIGIAFIWKDRPVFGAVLAAAAVIFGGLAVYRRYGGKEKTWEKPDIQELDRQKPDTQELDRQKWDIQEPDIQKPDTQKSDIQESDALESDIQENLERLNYRIAGLQERKDMCREALYERNCRLENLEEEYREQREDNDRLLEIRREMRCIDIASEKLKEAAAGMQNMTGRILQKKMSDMVCDMTEGRYKQVVLDEDFGIYLDNGEKCLQLYQVSYGTAEQVYLALRIACRELLCKEEELPLVLDEVFAMYDDKRLIKTLEWLSRRTPQVILFSCNKREIQALEHMKIPFHLETL